MRVCAHYACAHASMGVRLQIVCNVLDHAGEPKYRKLKVHRVGHPPSRTAQHDAARRSTAQHGAAQNGTVWHSAARYGTVRTLRRRMKR